MSPNPPLAAACFAAAAAADANAKAPTQLAAEARVVHYHQVQACPTRPP